jgi:hypothetical protein
MYEMHIGKSMKKSDKKGWRRGREFVDKTWTV